MRILKGLSSSTQESAKCAEFETVRIVLPFVKEVYNEFHPYKNKI